MMVKLLDVSNKLLIVCNKLLEICTDLLFPRKTNHWSLLKAMKTEIDKYFLNDLD